MLTTWLGEITVSVESDSQLPYDVMATLLFAITHTGWSEVVTYVSHLFCKSCFCFYISKQYKFQNISIITEIYQYFIRNNVIKCYFNVSLELRGIYLPFFSCYCKVMNLTVREYAVVF